MNFLMNLPATLALFFAFIVAFICWVEKFSFPEFCIRISISIVIVYLLTYVLCYIIRKMYDKIEETKAEESKLEEEKKRVKEKEEEKDKKISDIVKDSDDEVLEELEMEVLRENDNIINTKDYDK